MSSLELQDRSLAVVVIETTVCLVMNIISIIGNTLVCLAVYKNPKLRSTTNLYIIALAASDLLCAILDMPFASVVLITGRWDLGDALCEIQAFVDVFVTNVTPAIMGLTAFNRYMRIVKTHNYNKVFSAQKSYIWLSCVWISSALYTITIRVTNWSKFDFDPGYAVCSVVFLTEERRIAHYCVVWSVFLVLPFSVAFYSYYKITKKIRQHKMNVAPSLELNVQNRAAGRVSVQEINLSRVLSYVVAGFLLCWVPMWVFIFWKRFSPETAPRGIQLSAIFLLFLSSTINPFIYAATNRAFREEFGNLLCWWKKGRITPEVAHSAAKDRNVDSGVTKQQQGETIT
ncbi:melatonin receptor type 1B-like [Oculina patagonica]